MKQLRIVSLLPSGTEIVYLLGLGSSLVGRSHDSNFPPEVVKDVSVVSDTEITNQLSSSEIDRKVKESAHRGASIFHVDGKKLAELKPDIIITQELCPVCAPDAKDVEKVCARLGKHMKGVKIISLSPHSLEDVFAGILEIGEACRVREKAEKEVEKLRRRVREVEVRTKHAGRPNAVVIEWLDPLMTAGHWVPEMVEKAGGRILLSKAGGKSKAEAWKEVVAANPDFLIIAPCGFGIERTKKEASILKSMPGWSELKSVKNGRAFMMDGDAYLTRPGPRLVDGIEILAKIFHPGIFGSPVLAQAERIS